jgi:hypothetical protein
VSKKKNNYITKAVDYKSPVCRITKKNSQFFLVPALVDFNVGTPGGTKNIQMLFHFCGHVLKKVVGYSSHSGPYCGLLAPEDGCFRNGGRGYSYKKRNPMWLL